MQKLFTCPVCQTQFSRYIYPDRPLKNPTCSRTCKGLLQHKSLKGDANPNYRHGDYSNASLCSCGKQKDFRAQQCSSCSKRGYPLNKSHYIDKDAVLEAIQSSLSYAEASRISGVTRNRVRQIASKHNADIAHFRKHDVSLSPKQYPHGVRGKILRENLLPYMCARCSSPPLWNGTPLILELDHIDGNRMNNALSNLRFLCPNCHSQCPTSKGRNRKYSASS